MSQLTGVLLLNVGTPDAPESSAVRLYLREFLSDPRVIDIPGWARWLLLNFLILPLRPAKSAAAYRKVWGPAGSPLMVHSRALQKEISKSLGPSYIVEVAMRYGKPSIEAAYQRFQAAAVAQIVVVPLYPQYSSAATGSSLEKVFQVFGSQWNVIPLKVVGTFFDHPGFIASFAAVGKPILETSKPDHVLFSFHGLPERHMLKSDESKSHCLQKEDCCTNPGAALAYCYRAQCYRTAAVLAEHLGVDSGSYTVAFQSRLGRTPWIKPYTDLVLPELASRGVKRLAVFCPAFVADCLETEEEIGIRAKESFEAAGGAALTLVPSLNGSPLWVQTLAQMIRAHS